MTSEILSTPSTGKSLGLTPVRMRWTYFADRRPILTPPARRRYTCAISAIQPGDDPKIDSLLRQKRLGLSDLGPIGIGFCADRNKLGEVSLGFLAITGCLRRTSRSVESPVAVRVLLERRLELSERRSRLSCLQQ